MATDWATAAEQGTPPSTGDNKDDDPFLSVIRHHKGRGIKEINNLHRSLTAPRRMQPFHSGVAKDNCQKTAFPWAAGFS